MLDELDRDKCTACGSLDLGATDAEEFDTTARLSLFFDSSRTRPDVDDSTDKHAGGTGRPIARKERIPGDLPPAQ